MTTTQLTITQMTTTQMTITQMTNRQIEIIQKAVPQMTITPNNFVLNLNHIIHAPIVQV